MQIGNITVIVDPTHKITKLNVTPAECLILRAMHLKGSNGTPLENLSVTGDAETVLTPARPAQEAYFDQHRGKHIEAVAGVPAVTKKRSQAEEIERLKRLYTGRIGELPAFEAVFGNQARVKIPETFKEIAEDLALESAPAVVGIEGLIATAKDESAKADQAADRMVSFAKLAADVAKHAKGDAKKQADQHAKDASDAAEVAVIAAKSAAQRLSELLANQE